MTVYCWMAKIGVHYHLSTERPRVATEEETWGHIQIGDIVGGMGTISFFAPVGMEPMLPAAGEIREMEFHEQLWGKAKELPSYDKKVWTQIQRMLGD